jgi:2-keto-4-pentenoate hydratase/2-oxohepta-3-ene-1,7-dioic acid hydratase in catechol pathway
MKLVTFRLGGAEHPGVVVGDVVVDASLCDDRFASTRLLLEQAEDLQAVGARAEELALRGEVVGRLEALELGAPVPDPDKVVCVGLNYSAHVAEAGREEPEYPALFAKFSNSLSGPSDPILTPPVSNEVDYEGELVVVIGRPTLRVSAEQALDHVAGVTVGNDVSARDLQYRTAQWLQGKAIDTFLPTGPMLVTLDEFGELGEKRLSTRVDGETVQDAALSEMTRAVPELVATISEAMTLLPGDLICTGTPSGVGNRREPPLFLTPGKVVEVEIEGIGTIRNEVRAA